MKTAIEYRRQSSDIPAVYRGLQYEEKEISFSIKASFPYCIHASIPLTCRVRSSH